MYDYYFILLISQKTNSIVHKKECFLLHIIFNFSRQFESQNFCFVQKTQEICLKWTERVKFLQKLQIFHVHRSFLEKKVEFVFLNQILVDPKIIFGPWIRKVTWFLHFFYDFSFVFDFSFVKPKHSMISFIPSYYFSNTLI